MIRRSPPFRSEADADGFTILAEYDCTAPLVQVLLSTPDDRYLLVMWAPGGFIIGMAYGGAEAHCRAWEGFIAGMERARKIKASRELVKQA